MCACSLDHITPSRLGAIVFANSSTIYSNKDSRRSLALASTTRSMRQSSQTLATSHVFKEQDRPSASPINTCVRCHSTVPAPGGASRDRTDDPLLAKQVLSQLSYGPVRSTFRRADGVVGLGGLEPPTSPLSGVRSNHLSYRPRPDPRCGMQETCADA